MCLKEADTQKRGHLDFSDFQRLTKVLKRRPDIQVIYNAICLSNQGSLDVTAFQKFMRKSQKVRF